MSRRSLNESMKFVGRSAEVRVALKHCDKPGHHLVVIGPRGVGKSAFVIAAGDASDSDRVWFSCQSTSTLLDVARVILIQLGFDVTVSEIEREVGKKISGGATPFGVGMSIDGVETTLTKELGPLPASSTPWGLLNTLRNRERPIWLVLDDFDRTAANEQFANSVLELMKIAAQAPAPADMHVVLVGTATSISELLHYHQSIERALLVIELEPLAANDVYDWIRAAEAVADVKLPADVRVQLAMASLGYPYYLDLLFRSVVEEAQDLRREVSLEMYCDVRDRVLHERVRVAQPELRVLLESADYRAAKVMAASEYQPQTPTDLFVDRLRASGMRDGEIAEALSALDRAGVLRVDSRSKIVRFCDRAKLPLLQWWAERTAR